MSDRIVILDWDVASARWVANLLQHEGYSIETVARSQDIFQLFQHQPPQLVILERDLGDGDGLEVCRRLRELANHSTLAIIFFSRHGQPQDIVAGMQAGADDYVLKRLGADVELVAKVKSLLARLVPQAEEPMAPGGRLISFFSPKGGTGTTTICVNTAYVLAAEQRQANVLVVDMVLPLGTVDQFVNFHSDKTLAQLTCDAQNGVDQKLIGQYVSEKNQHNFHVLLGANDFHEARTLDVNQIRPIFREMVKHFDYVLVDVGRSLSAITLPILQMSDLIVMLLTSDINAVQLGKKSLKYIREMGIDEGHLFVINNRVIPRVWISKEETEAIIGSPMRMVIPYDGEEMPLAVNRGEPYMVKFRFSVTGLQIQDLARQLIQQLKALGAREAKTSRA